jgi:hypothetical protein
MIHAVVGAAVRTSNRSVVRAAYPIIALCVALFSAVPGAQAASRWATLEAIHKLENPRNSPKPGRHGELGAYQFRSSTWKMHTSVPFQLAIDKGASDAVAVKHYEWIKRGLEAARVPATPYYIALAWNGGLSAAISGRSPRIAHDYAQRAANLAASYDVTPAKNPTQLLADLGSNNSPLAAQ